MSTEPVDIYLAFVGFALLVLTPVLIVLTIYSWGLAIRRRPYRLPFIFAISNTIVGGCATYLSWSVLYRIREGHPLPSEFLPVSATVILMLCIVPFIHTVYLAFLEARR